MHCRNFHRQNYCHVQIEVKGTTFGVVKLVDHLSFSRKQYYLVAS